MALRTILLTYSGGNRRLILTWMSFFSDIKLVTLTYESIHRKYDNKRFKLQPTNPRLPSCADALLSAE